MNFKSGIRGKYADKNIEIIGAVERPAITAIAAKKATQVLHQKKRKVIKGTVEEK